MAFVWQRGDLNDEQTDAIEHEGNVFLAACPGSGKTRALTYKIALELSKLESGLASEKWRGFLELKGNRNAEAEEFYQGI